MTKFYHSLFILAIFVLNSCDEPGVVGLEVQPSSDKIEIFSNNFSQADSLPAFVISTESVDSLRTDETSSLLLGKISNPYDPYFGDNIAAFVTQIALTESNIDLGNNPVVDSVVMSYSYSGYYGDLSSPIKISINHVDLNIYKDSVYYSNYQFSNSSNISEDLLLDFTISSDTSPSPTLKMILDNSIGQQILDLGNSILVDNETFQENFGFFSFNEYSLIANSIIYLNPSGSNSNFTIYYHNSTSDTLSLSFILDGDAARINLFNEKPLSNLTIDSNLSYIQSMAGYKANIALENINSIKEDLEANDLCGLKNLNVNTLNKFAISYSDAVVQASEKINKSVLNSIEDSGKPFLDFPGDEEYEKEYLNFYENFIATDDKVEVEA